MLVDYWIKPWVLFQEGLVGHHYQWYAMVNRCLALVVSTHSITQERERERERERDIEGKHELFWTKFCQKKWTYANVGKVVARHPAREMIHESPTKMAFVWVYAQRFLVYDKVRGCYHMHNNKNRRENYFCLSYTNSFSSLLLKEKLFILGYLSLVGFGWKFKQANFLFKYGDFILLILRNKKC